MPAKRKAAVEATKKAKQQKKEEEEEDDEISDEEEKPVVPKKKAPEPKGAFGLSWREEDDTLYILDSEEIKGSEKIVAFDMDSTLVVPKSGAKFPKNRNDWKWVMPEIVPKLKELNQKGYKVIIFTNQAGIEKNKQNPADIKGKILDLATELGFPIQAFVAAATDAWRKPNTSMWDFMIKNHNGGVQPDFNECTFVGDAAGRAKGWKTGAAKDFSCADRTFASNIGVKFATPEEFFLGEGSVAFEWDSIDPNTVLEGIKVVANYDNIASNTTELIVMVGCPASGKSSFSKKFLVPKGYVHVNMDTLKTKPKCIKACEEAISNGKSVVIDNTNPSIAARAEFTQFAKAKGIPFRCFVMQTDVKLAHHLNFYREKIAGVRRIPDVGYNVFKSKFQEPTTNEGFTEVIKIDWIPDFENDHHKKLFLQRT